MAADDQTTILLYENHRVKAKFTFTADKPLDDAGVQAVLDAVAKLVKEREAGWPKPAGIVDYQPVYGTGSRPCRLIKASAARAACPPIAAF